MSGEAEKPCFKCGEIKPLHEFYRQESMKDGHVNKCKECTKRDVANRYVEKRDLIAEYERKRARSPERKAKVAEYQRIRRKRHPEKERARRLVNQHLMRGTLKRQPCEVCGDPDSEAHHTDYSKPLDVKWLCFTHHRQAHGQTVTAI